MTRWEKNYRDFADTRPAEAIDREVLQYLESLGEDKRILIACSGGADSVYLLLTILSLFENEWERLLVVHFNHGVRGADSAADADFVLKLAADLGLEVELGQPVKPVEADEAELRTARFSWISRIYDSVQAGAIVLGHHADDLVESLVMGILSGAGPAGLASPMPLKRFSDGQVRLRPLLPLRRRQIESTLKSLRIPWREDATNADTRYTRNWLRKDILPLLHAYMPQDIAAAGQRTRLLMAEALEAIDIQLQSLQLETSYPQTLKLLRLAGQPSGLIRRALTAWWIRHHPENPLPKTITDKLVAAIHNEESIVISFNYNLSFNFNSANRTLSLFTTPSSDKPAPWPAALHWSCLSGPACLPSGAMLRAAVRKFPNSPDEPAPYLSADPAREAWIDLNPTQPLTVRQWLPGDKYRPLGAPGRRKLQDLFVDAKLSPEQKQKLPVILNRDDEIIWIPGFPPADDFKVCPKSNSALQLTYTIHSTAFPLQHGG